MPKQATQPLPPLHERPTRERLLEIMQHRILVLDGAYGSAFQNYSLSELTEILVLRCSAPRELEVE